MERTLFQTLCIIAKNITMFAGIGIMVYIGIALDERAEKRAEKRQILKNKRKRTRGKSLKR